MPGQNLCDRTIEWYGDRTLKLCDFWVGQGSVLASQLTVDEVEAALVALRRRGLSPQTVRGFAQLAKTLCRFGHRKGLIEHDIARDLEMPKVPQTIIPTFSDEQLEALLAAPDKRKWRGIRDRALLLTLLDTLCRASELVGLNAEDVDVKGRTIRVMGKGRKQRELPLGKATCQALESTVSSRSTLTGSDSASRLKRSVGPPTRARYCTSSPSMRNYPGTEPPYGLPPENRSSARRAIPRADEDGTPDWGHGRSHRSGLRGLIDGERYSARQPGSQRFGLAWGYFIIPPISVTLSLLGVLQSLV